MTCSAAQLAANQKNAQASTGPRTDRGKSISRSNALTHGLTAEVVLQTEDVAVFEERLAQLDDEIRPTTAIEVGLVGRVALLFTRLERSAKHEARAIDSKMRNAAVTFDDARMAEADHLISWIAHEPVTNNRRLKRTPEGLQRLIAALEGLRSDLARQPSYRWDYGHCDQLHHYLGMRREVMPISRARALTEAIHGKFDNIDLEKIPETETMAKRRWAIGQMFELIDGELKTLKALLETFDDATLEQDRAEAGDRAIFDDSKEGILARKYEAATERSLYKALRELRELRTDSRQVERVEDVTPQPTDELGSIPPEDSGEVPKESNVDPKPPVEATETPRKRPNLEKLVRPGRRQPKST
jgi:hypothetical protein